MIEETGDEQNRNTGRYCIPARKVGKQYKSGQELLDFGRLLNKMAVLSVLVVVTMRARGFMMRHMNGMFWCICIFPVPSVSSSIPYLPGSFISKIRPVICTFTAHQQGVLHCD